MTEEAELQAKIAALAGRINVAQSNRGHHAPHMSNYGHQRGDARWSPYPAPQTHTRNAFPGRVIKPHRNRTLVLNGAGPSTPGVASPDTAVATKPATGWVSKHDRHMTLINNSVYDQKTQERTKAIQETERQKQKARDNVEKEKVAKHFTRVTSSTKSGPTKLHEVAVNNVRFRVTADGSKLMRIFGEPSDESRINERVQLLSSTDGNDAVEATPKQTEISGVTFFRTKHGNLYRLGLVKSAIRYRMSPCNTAPQKRMLTCLRRRKNVVKKASEQCPRFTATGTCSQGNRCRYMHDPSKVAICKTFLHTGSCPNGDFCDLSHTISPTRVPACTHFLRGNCTKGEQCHYAHVRVNPAAPICKPFATLGYCAKGATCEDRHFFECPSYANTGKCNNANCRLPHVDRAGSLRKVAANKEQVSSDDNECSDLSSEEEDKEYDEIDSDDVDSDNLDGEDTVTAGSDHNDHELIQQQDYVPLF
ncbi:hypothetical protein LTR66_012800 [Elasticomyces elasticus]|nr:hypothetical protein LTR66_012800 [Elasticomyces elasticus]